MMTFSPYFLSACFYDYLFAHLYSLLCPLLYVNHIVYFVQLHHTPCAHQRQAVSDERGNAPAGNPAHPRSRRYPPACLRADLFKQAVEIRLLRKRRDDAAYLAPFLREGFLRHSGEAVVLIFAYERAGEPLAEKMRVTLPPAPVRNRAGRARCPPLSVQGAYTPARRRAFPTPVFSPCIAGI